MRHKNLLKAFAIVSIILVGGAQTMPALVLVLLPRNPSYYLIFIPIIIGMIVNITYVIAFIRSKLFTAKPRTTQPPAVVAPTAGSTAATTAVLAPEPPKDRSVALYVVMIFVALAITIGIPTFFIEKSHANQLRAKYQAAVERCDGEPVVITRSIDLYGMTSYEAFAPSWTDYDQRKFYNTMYDLGEAVDYTCSLSEAQNSYPIRHVFEVLTIEEKVEALRKSLRQLESKYDMRIQTLVYVPEGFSLDNSDLGYDSIIFNYVSTSGQNITFTCVGQESRVKIPEEYTELEGQAISDPKIEADRIVWSDEEAFEPFDPKNPKQSVKAQVIDSAEITMQRSLKGQVQLWVATYLDVTNKTYTICTLFDPQGTVSKEDGEKMIRESRSLDISKVDEGYITD